MLRALRRIAERLRADPEIRAAIAEIGAGLVEIGLDALLQTGRGQAGQPAGQASHGEVKGAVGNVPTARATRR